MDRLQCDTDRGLYPQAAGFNHAGFHGFSGEKAAGDGEGKDDNRIHWVVYETYGTSGRCFRGERKILPQSGCVRCQGILERNPASFSLCLVVKSSAVESYLIGEGTGDFERKMDQSPMKRERLRWDHPRQQVSL
jgi:hypothetical protein